MESKPELDPMEKSAREILAFIAVFFLIVAASALLGIVIVGGFFFMSVLISLF